MINSKLALKKLIDGLLLVVNKELKNAPFDKTVQGIIIEEIVPANKYKVLINDDQYIVKSKSNHSVGDIVYILIPQNNYNNMIILF